ncbi:FAD-binding dehydrogenase [Lentzea guizhouensis]|uniref:FAD-binding dehydrogenase n=2 Tax=Lentzea guizhouensis TaxID=1586287 RepID=A0A1B2HIX0_9PSEU|nr:FAD-binding dehydrogenase [Lentzea guizhouensis]
MGMTRRTFLRGTGLAVAGTGVGTPAMAETNWERLRRRLGDRLVLPQDSGYDTLRLPFNTVYAHRRPAAIARCVRAEDVQACLDFASHERIPVAARSGKHSYAAYSVPENGLVVDVSALTNVRFHGTDVQVGAGVRLGDFYETIGAQGRAVPGGTCKSVGISGLTLGGGIGVIGRKYGLTCDNLLSARIVTPDGCLRTVSERQEPDLFWALRGGGGGNFGIVTSFTFRSVPAPDVTRFLLLYPAGATADVVDAWQEWFSDAPDELWAICETLSGTPTSTAVGGTYLGPAKDLHPLLDRMPAGTQRVVEEMTYLEAMRFYAGGDETGAAFVASSRMAYEHVPGSRVDELLQGGSGYRIQFDSFGGALGRVAPDATAFPHRRALASAQCYVNVVDGRTEAEGRRILASLRDGLGTGTTGYVNYIDPEMPDWAVAYYGGNLPRLRKVRRRYDPDRVLAFAQGL